MGVIRAETERASLRPLVFAELSHDMGVQPKRLHTLRLHQVAGLEESCRAITCSPTSMPA
jgi:hypothetical protein